MDIELIEKQVKKVIEYSQDIYNADVKNLIEEWYEAKRDFIEMFGDQLIYMTTNKISIDLNEEQKESKVGDLCDQIGNRFFPKYQDLIRFIYLNRSDFFKNILSNSYKHGNYNIPAGIKISKAFREFVEDKDDLYEIQQLASKIIQEGKITGYLCFSVHPLDYLSSSENSYNWRSCHALDGEYRAGNLSYMLDRCTVVCYLCDDKQVKIPRFPPSVPWNSKKWRMLLFVSDNRNALFAGRHYPFFSNSLMEEVRWRWVILDRKKNAFFEISEWSYWHNDNFKRIHFAKHDRDDDFILDERHVPIRDKIYPMSSLVIDPDEPLHFNDLLHSNTYVPYYCWKTYSRKKIQFHVGAEANCVLCGNKLHNHESMLCDDCLTRSGYVYCSCCDDLIKIEDAIELQDGDYVCRSCFEENYMECPCCLEIYHVDDMVWNEDRDTYYCRNCYDEMHSG